MLNRKCALFAIIGMLFSPLAFAQDATTEQGAEAAASQGAEAGTAGGVAAGDTALGGIANALGVTQTTVVVGAAVVATGVVVAASNSGGGTGTVSAD